MTLPSKLLWSEGLALDAQHLQQLDRYHEGRLHHIASALNPDAWGVQSARWSTENVPHGELRAEALTLVFRDGEIHQAPYSDPLPLAIDLTDLPATEPDFVFYAALPAMRSRGGNVSRADYPKEGTAPEENARFAQLEMVTLDLFTDAISSKLLYLKKSLRLLSHLEVRDAFECIPVVKIRRKADGTFEIDPNFIPPALSVEAAPALQNLLRNLLAKMSAKADALYALQRQPKGSNVEAHVGDVTSFFMLSTITTASAGLGHGASLAHTHPAQLFDKLLTLAGGLMAFSRKYSVANLPRYDHAMPTDAFQTLVDIIRELLDTVVSSKYVPIPLPRKSEDSAYRIAQLDPAIIDAKARLYFAISANMPALNLVADIPRLLKTGSPDQIEIMVRSAVSGIPLVHMPQVPMEVPVRPDTYYFAIENRGERFEAMIKAQALAVFAPSTLKELNVELFAIMN
jgi:type VI secretion system protein ImpJ